jgi:hypothetical protein
MLLRERAIAHLSPVFFILREWAVRNSLLYFAHPIPAVGAAPKHPYEPAPYLVLGRSDRSKAWERTSIWL